MQKDNWKKIPLIQEFSKEEILKSIGLYWRTWPEKKPEEGERCIVWMDSGDYFMGTHAGIVRQWNHDSGWKVVIKTGDRWLPLSVLSILPNCQGKSLP